MLKKILLILLILTLLSGCKKDTTEPIKVIYSTEYDNGGVFIEGQGYPCGYQDNVCPDDYSPSKPVCQKVDPDCIQE